MPPRITIRTARLIALAAQGMNSRTRRPTKLAAYASIERTGLWQVDSVNVFARSHLMPWYSRNGAYDLQLFDELAWGSNSKLVEYVGHEATLMPRSWLPRFAWRMEAMRNRYLAEGAWLSSQPKLQTRLKSQLLTHGPQTSQELELDRHTRSSPWWGWTDAKRALELMFRCGILTSVERRGFRRVYALPEQVLDDTSLTKMPREQAQYELVKHAVSAVGVGTRADIADYFRMGAADTQRAIDTLTAEGTIQPISVSGWSEPAWIATGAPKSPQGIRDAILSPFDPIVWTGPRTKRLFGMDYRIEIYTPAHKRKYGYYSLPLLVSGNLVGRTDLKADRQNSTLRVQSAWAEPEVDPACIADSVVQLLSEAASWQNLSKIEVADVGSLAEQLCASF